jgi:pyruvate carboxylase
VHRLKADESYQIGEIGHRSAPTCRSSRSSLRLAAPGPDAIYPGYGFLSENTELAEASSTAGIAYVGPPPARSWS